MANIEPVRNAEPVVAEQAMVRAATQTIRDFHTWSELVRDTFPWLEIHNHSHDRFHAEIASRRFPQAMLASMSLGASEVRRTRQLADRAEVGHIKILSQISGRIELEQDRRTCVLLPGQATVCDSARAYTIRIHQDARFVVLMLPYSVCAGWERISQRICGSSLSNALTIRSAIAALSALSGAGDQDPEPSRTAVLKAAEWMLCSALTGNPDAPALSEAPSGRFHLVEAYVERHLDDPGLDVDNLASAVCMSRRALYSLFEQHRTTPARMIQNLRLRRSRQLLDEIASRARTITEIAFDCGFSDYATFSRLFKQRYGSTPREYRSAALFARH